MACGAFALGGGASRAGAPSDSVAIVDATIFDSAGRPPYRGTVIVSDGRIAAVGPDVRPPRGARMVQADGRALLPGFIDVHTHWSPSGQPSALPQIASVPAKPGCDSPQQQENLPASRTPICMPSTSRLPSPVTPTATITPTGKAWRTFTWVTSSRG